jgi:hypothetical protein
MDYDRIELLNKDRLVLSHGVVFKGLARPLGFSRGRASLDDVLIASVSLLAKSSFSWKKKIEIQSHSFCI